MPTGGYEPQTTSGERILEVPMARLYEEFDDEDMDEDAPGWDICPP